MKDSLERLWRLLFGTSSTETDSAEPDESRESLADEWDTEPEGILADYDPSALSSRKDFLLELGISYDEFFCHLIEEQGGILPQKTFKEVTNLSSSTISRLLQEMVEDGQVVRVQVGRENVICLPAHAPSVGFSSPDDSDDTLRV